MPFEISHLARRWRPAFASVVLVFLVSGFLGSAWAEGEAAREESPLSAAGSLRGLQIVPGFRVEIAAAEPQVLDPVSARFGPKGRLWVVEMGDYPLGPTAGEEPAGRIKVLSDEDGDGRFESVRLFAKGLVFPNGTAPWKNGVVVTAAEKVFWLADEDGDGRADTRRVLLEGFGEKNSQLLPSHATWSIEGALYIGNGLRNQTARVLEPGGPRELVIRGRDIRLWPGPGMTFRAEPVLGLSQFGMTFDDEGRRIVSTNRQPGYHVVIEDRYLSQGAARGVAGAGWDVLPSPGKVFPISANWTTSNLHQGTFTAASGTHIARGDAMGDAQGDVFVCDSTGNLVHRSALELTGATWRSYRREEDREFLCSKDEWFRPVDLFSGPDGALYVVDMYRAVIEHPDFMPPELVGRPDQMLGQDRGRIWRIVATDAEPDRKRVPADLTSASDKVLVDLLGHPDAWHRDEAQRLLRERAEEDEARKAAIRALLEPSALCDWRPLARLHALWALRRMVDAPPNRDFFERVLGDPDPRVRRAALRCSEQWGEMADDPARAFHVMARVNDENPAVRFQALLSAALEPDTISRRRWLAFSVGFRSEVSAPDEWFRKAVLISIPRSEGAATAVAEDVLRRVESGSRADRRFGEGTGRGFFAPKPEVAALLRDLAAAAAAEDTPADLARWLARVDPAAEETGSGRGWKRSVALGLVEGAVRRKTTLERLVEEDERAAHVLERVFDAAARDALDAELPVSERLLAIELLGATPLDRRGPTLATLLEPPAPLEVQRAALGALLVRGELAAPAELIDRWESLTPALRRAATGRLIARTPWALRLLDAVAEEVVSAGEISLAEREKLLASRDETVRQRARELLPAPSGEDRAEVIAKYRSALSLKGDKARGRQVYERVCATCHRVADLGQDVGPDISDTRIRTEEALLVDILDPNRAIDANYIAYNVVASDGRVLSGVIAEETSTGISLAGSEGQLEQLPRSDILDISSSGLSLMPEGAEADVDLQQMADLIRFLKDWRYGEGFPLGDAAAKPADPAAP